MAVLPVSDISLDPDVQITSEPSKTWYIDKLSGKIQGYCDGYDAVRQAIDIILNTDRFRWQIYDPSSGVDYSNLVGADNGYVAAELHRRIREALLMDNRILGLDNFKADFSGDALSVSFTVHTVYGDINESLEALND